MKRLLDSHHGDIRTLTHHTLPNTLSDATHGQAGDTLVYGNSSGQQVLAGREEFWTDLKTI